MDTGETRNSRLDQHQRITRALEDEVQTLTDDRVVLLEELRVAQVTCGRVEGEALAARDRAESIAEELRAVVMVSEGQSKRLAESEEHKDVQRKKIEALERACAAKGEEALAAEARVEGLLRKLGEQDKRSQSVQQTVDALEKQTMELCGEREREVERLRDELAKVRRAKELVEKEFERWKEEANKQTQIREGEIARLRSEGASMAKERKEMLEQIRNRDDLLKEAGSLSERDERISRDLKGERDTLRRQIRELSDSNVATRQQNDQQREALKELEGERAELVIRNETLQRRLTEADKGWKDCAQRNGELEELALDMRKWSESVQRDAEEQRALASELRGRLDASGRRENENAGLRGELEGLRQRLEGLEEQKRVLKEEAEKEGKHKVELLLEVSETKRQNSNVVSECTELKTSLDALREEHKAGKILLERQGHVMRELQDRCEEGERKIKSLSEAKRKGEKERTSLKEAFQALEQRFLEESTNADRLYRECSVTKDKLHANAVVNSQLFQLMSSLIASADRGDVDLSGSLSSKDRTAGGQLV